MVTNFAPPYNPFKNTSIIVYVCVCVCMLCLDRIPQSVRVANAAWGEEDERTTRHLNSVLACIQPKSSTPKAQSGSGGDDADVVWQQQFSSLDNNNSNNECKRRRLRQQQQQVNQRGRARRGALTTQNPLRQAREKNPTRRHTHTCT